MNIDPKWADVFLRSVGFLLNMVKPLTPSERAALMYVCALRELQCDEPHLRAQAALAVLLDGYGFENQAAILTEARAGAKVILDNPCCGEHGSIARRLDDYAKLLLAETDRL